MQWIALALVAGNVIATFCHGPPDRGETVVFLIMATGALFLSLRFGSRLALLLAVLLLGAFQALSSASSFHDRLDRLTFPVKNADVTVRILSMPTCYPEACQYRAEIVSADQDSLIGLNVALWHDRRAVEARSPIVSPKLDEHWAMTLSIKPVYGRSNPAGQNREQQMYRQYVDVSASVDGRAIRLQPARSAAARVRDQIILWIDQQTQHTESAAILKALSAGDTRSISQSQWQAFRQTGSLHLMAISGLHIGLIASCGWGLARVLYRIKWLRQRSSRARLAVYPALLLAALYSLMAGLSLPTQRALIMLCGVALATVCLRRQNGWQPFSLAMLLVLLIDPRQTLSPGFWFSFTAVAVLIGSAQCHPYWRHGRRSWWLIQWVVLCGLLPVSLGFGQPINPLSPILNLILIPYLGIVLLPLLMMGLIGGLSLDLLTDSIHQSGSWGGTLLKPAQWAAQLMSDALQWASDLLSWQVQIPASLVTLAISIVLVILLLGPGFRSWLLSGLMGAVILMSIMFQRPESRLRLHVLDVGQGLSVVIEYPGGYGIYDTGPGRPGRPGSSEQVIEPMLAHLFGPRNPDFILLSHHDNDHAGGFERLSQVRPAARHYLSGTTLERGHCRQGQSWVHGKTEFMILHPGEGLPYQGNNSSCVLLIRHGNQTVLLPGDIGSVIESRLLRLYPDQLEDVSVLVAAHHGSRSSSAEAFVSHLMPQWVVVSSGRGNRFGLPHPAVINRFRALGSRVVDTADCGYLQIAWDELGPRVLQRHRLDRPRLWHRRVENDQNCDLDA